ncbi:MAG: efflux RND transporter periplasmic adaptor subunit [Hyphomicrobiales bacterium]|nr:MAG: efflux RND transporter periplasmic adaptor subunit [Hyphomicrobiales bacterium]
MSGQNKADDTERAERTDGDIASVLGLEGAEASPWRRPGRWLALAALLVLAGALAYGLLLADGGNGKARYVTQPAKRGDLVIIVTAVGTVQPTNQVDISSELSGTIRKVMADYNSKVKAGQVLAELDTDKLKASAESARAKLAARKAAVKDAEATRTEKRLDYERKQNLSRQKIGTGHDLETARAAYDRAIAALERAEADVAAAEADLKLNETNLRKTCICSPINGVVLSRNVEPGQTVASSLQAPVLFTIAEDLTKMEVHVDVDEADIGKVSEGQKASFSVDAYPGRRFTATIRELRFGSEIVQGVVTYKAVLTAANPDLLLRPGMTATAEITVQHLKDALTVPNAALRFTPAASAKTRDNRSFLEKLLPGRPRLRRPAARTEANGDARALWVLKDGRPKKLNVTIGPTDGRRTQILKGALAPEQPVITDMMSAKD